MLLSYLMILVIFFGPLAAHAFADQFFPESDATRWTETALTVSPFAAAYEVPFYDPEAEPRDRRWIPAPETETLLFGYQLSDWRETGSYLIWTTLLTGFLLVVMLWLFRNRWRVSESGQ